MSNPPPELLTSKTGVDERWYDGAKVTKAELAVEVTRLTAERDWLKALLWQALHDTEVGLTESEGLEWIKNTRAALAGQQSETGDCLRTDDDPLKPPAPL